MGYQLKQGDMEQVFDRLTSGYDIYGPVCMKGEGDVFRYGCGALWADTYL